jgi:ubiquitin-like-conjugating enzyme ATG10
VVRALQRIHPQNKVEDDWDFVSVDEHPVSRVPSFFLHPCRTEERMMALSKAHDTPPAVRLLSWLSMILPSVGYSVPSSMFWSIKKKLDELEEQP